MHVNIKKELREWIILISIAGIVYLFGWHTVLISKVQQAVLYSGIIQPSISDDLGNASYDFVLEDLDGQKIDFNEFEGKTIFVNFWASWCAPCLAEMPDIQSLYDQTGAEISFVMISLDKEELKARELVQKRNFSFPVYFLRSSLPTTYQTRSIPTTYVIDKSGKIRVNNSGMAKYNTKQFKEFLTQIM